jgi:hypothetical protein
VARRVPSGLTVTSRIATGVAQQGELLFAGCDVPNEAGRGGEAAPVGAERDAPGQAPPLGPGVPVVLMPAGRVVRRDRLGGLIHEYEQVA